MTHPVRPIYFIVSIDTECDKMPDWSVRHPLQFRSIVDGIPRLLQPVFSKHGVKPTYLLSPEVIRDTVSARTLQSLGDGAELGTHLHGEFIEPDKISSPQGTFAFQCDYPADVEFEKMRNLTNLFTETFGYRPRSFRAGRFGIGRSTLKTLDDLEYWVDSSILPFKKITTQTAYNNYYYYPVKAFFPDYNNYRLPVDFQHAGVLELPMTVHSSFYMRTPRLFGAPVASNRLIEAAFSKLLGRHQMKTYTLRPSSYSPDVMQRVMNAHIQLHSKDEPVFLNMMFHSNEIVEQASPVCQSSEDVERFLKRLDAVLRYAASLGARFIGLSEARSIVYQWMSLKPNAQSTARIHG
jgi:hypothetical protein